MYNLFKTFKDIPPNPTLFSLPYSFRPNEGCLSSPLGNVHLSILQTLKSRTPLLVSAYLWDKYSFKKALMLNKFGMRLLHLYVT